MANLIAAYFFYLLNLFTFFCGTALITLSLLFIGDRATARHLLSTLIDDDQLVELVIVLGTKVASVSLLLGFLLAATAGTGCLGALRRSDQLLQAYIAVVAVLLCLTMAAVIAMAVNKSKVLKRLTTHLYTKLSAGYDGKHTGENGATLLIDAIQIQFDCCGITSYLDYEKASTWEDKEFENYTGLRYPATCCVWNASEPKNFIEPFDLHDKDACLTHSQQSGNLTATAENAKYTNFATSCESSLTKFTNGRLSVAFAVAAIIMVLESISMFAAYTFKRANSKEY